MQKQASPTQPQPVGQSPKSSARRPLPRTLPAPPYVERLLTFEEFVRTFDLPPLVSIKRALEVAGLKNSRFYELVNEGTFRIIKNGARSNVTAFNLYDYYVSLVSASVKDAA